MRKRHQPDFEAIAAYRQRKSEQGTSEKFDGDRGSPNGMTLDEVKDMLKGASRSGYKIPKALLPKPPF